MMGQLLETKVLIETFDDIKNVSNGIERRSARDFQKILDYTERRNFL